MAVVRVGFDVQMRPLDKGFEWPEPYDALFEQYVDTRLFDLGESALKQSCPEHISENSEPSKSSSGSDLACHPPVIEWEGARTEISQPWEKAVYCLKENSASPTFETRRPSSFPKSHSKAHVSSTNIDSLGQSYIPQIEIETAVSPLSDFIFPVAKGSESNVPSGLHDTQRTIPSLTSKSMRKASKSPRMMQSSNYRPTTHNEWIQRRGTPMTKYNLQITGNPEPLSPPPSSSVEQEEQGMLYGRMANDMGHDLQDTLSPLSTQFENLSHMTPLATPLIDPSNSQRNSYFDSTALTHYHEQSQFAVQPMHSLITPPQTQHLTMSAWSPEQQGEKSYEFQASSPDISDWPTENIAHARNNIAHESVHHTSHGLPGLTNDIQFGSTNHVSAAPMADMATNGLFIDMRGMSNGGELHSMDGKRGGSRSSSAGGFSALSPTDPKLNVAGCAQSYPPPPIIPASASPVNLTTNTSAPSRSRRPNSSPENSPNSPISYPHTRRGSSKQQKSHLSNNALQSSHSQQSSHRRSKSTASSRTHRSPTRAHRRHQRAQSSNSPCLGGAGNVGFVNFTPDDSRKILTGVAPSGSSKTKARREKEAAEKRRKLSEAAVKAVEEAGGDVSALTGVVLE